MFETFVVNFSHLLCKKHEASIRYQHIFRKNQFHKHTFRIII